MQIVSCKYDDKHKKIVHEYKYNLKRDLSNFIAKDMCRVLSLDKNSTYVIVPVPTSSRHIKTRGFDHTKLIAEELSNISDISVKSLLKRKHNKQQVGKLAEERKNQAKDAFYCTDKLSHNIKYVVIDDVSTTGATLTEAVKEIMRAGAKNVVCLAYTR